MRARLPVILLVLLWVGAVGWMGVRAWQRGFEYDELWTLEHYARVESAGRIFQDLATPNNHPLHSLLVRWTTGWFGANELAVRVPALVAGALLLALIPVGIWLVTQDREVTLLGGAWCLLNAPLVHYAQTARGYGVQTLLVVALAVSMRLSRRNPLWLVATVLAGVGAVFTLPTAVLYLAPLAMVDWVERRRDQRVWLAHGALGLVAAAWLWFGWPQFQEGRAQFGLPVGSAFEWLKFAGGILPDLFGWWLVILMVAGLIFGPRRGLQWTLAWVIVFPLLAAVVTHGGPARTYLPVVPFGMLLAALGVKRVLDFLQVRWPAVAVLALAPMLVLPAGLRRWTPTDWRQAVPVLEQELPTSVYINYPPTAGYVIRHYFRADIGRQMINRLPKGTELVLAEVEGAGGVRGMDGRTHRTVELPLPAKFSYEQRQVGGVTVTMVRAILEETLAAEPDQPEDRLCFVVVGPVEPIELPRRLAEVWMWMPVRTWIGLNGFIQSSDEQSDAGVVLVTRGLPAKIAQMWEWSAQSGGQVRFYVQVEAKL